MKLEDGIESPVEAEKFMATVAIDGTGQGFTLNRAGKTPSGQPFREGRYVGPKLAKLESGMDYGLSIVVLDLQGHFMASAAIDMVYVK